MPVAADGPVADAQGQQVAEFVADAAEAEENTIAGAIGGSR